MPDELDPILSFRVAFESPDARAADQLAAAINDLGLEVQHVTPRGLLVSGKKSVIEGGLRTHIDFSSGGAQFKVEPRISSLAGGKTVRTYFPRKPTFFGER